jgi:uncharacterized protein (DUF2235 family)
MSAVLSKDQTVEQSNREIKMGQSKNIVVLCDGTANQVTIYSHTNLVRLARRLDKTTSKDRRQVMFYDPGLGTESAPGALTSLGKAVTKFLGLAFGYGLSKNLADAYAFLMQNYEPGDRIYIFGFSRGAYTARALTGLLGRVGLLERGCESLIPYAIKYYHTSNAHQLNFFKKRFSRTYALKWRDVISEIKDTHLADRPSNGVIPVHFLGVWDTVKSVGILRWQVTLPDTDWLPNMINGRHAVAIDEKRSQYQPVLWDADTNSNHEDQTERRKSNLQTCLHHDIETKWFSGVHADVGGGYGLPAKLEKELIKIKIRLKELDWEKLPLARKANDNVNEDKFKKEKKELEDRIKEIKNIEEEETALAYVSLKWMIEAAEVHGLLLDKKKVAKDPQIENPNAMLHNPLFPFWWILGWRKRRATE